MQNAELNALIQEAREDVEAVGLPLPPADRFEFVVKTMRSWGTCKHRWYRGNFRFTITLSTYLMTCDHQAKINTLTHELIHACYPGQHHGATFKRACALLNSTFPFKYRLARTTAAEKKMDVEHAKTLYKHIIACPQCGKFYGFMRACASLDYLHVCPNCKTLMKQVK